MLIKHTCFFSFLGFILRDFDQKCMIYVILSKFSTGTCSSQIYFFFKSKVQWFSTNFLSFTAIKMELVNGRFVLFSEINLKDGFSKFSYIARAWFLRFSMYVFGVV